MQEMGKQPAGVPYAAYHNLDMQDMDVEVGFPVSKPLPEGEVVEHRPCRSRTCDTLIKSQVLIFPQSSNSLSVNPLRIKPSF